MTRELAMTATALELPVEAIGRLPDLRDLAMYLMLIGIGHPLVFPRQEMRRLTRRQKCQRQGVTSRCSSLQCAD
jgi:hypothetical protein